MTFTVDPDTVRCSACGHPRHASLYQNPQRPDKTYKTCQICRDANKTYAQLYRDEDRMPPEPAEEVQAGRRRVRGAIATCIHGRKACPTCGNV